METLVSLLNNAVDKYAGRIAVKSQITGESWTYKKLREQAWRVNAALLRRDVGRGDMIPIVCDNNPSFLAADYGVLYSGATAVPINERLKPEDLLIDYFSLVKPKLVLAERSYVEKVRKYTDVPVVSIEDTLMEAPLEPREEISPDHPSTIIFSSGTTSKTIRAFKAVVLSHKNVSSNVISTSHLSDRAERVDGFPQGIYMAGLARQWHSFAYMVQKAFLHSGALLHFTNERGVFLGGHGPKINPHYSIMVPERAGVIMRRIQKDIRKKGDNLYKLFQYFLEKSNEFNYQRINNSNFNFNGWLLHQLGNQTIYRIVRKGLRQKVGKNIRYLIGGSAPLPLEIQEFFYSIGLPIYQGYGLTETSPVISVNVPEAYRFGSSGKPIRGVEVLIADPDSIKSGTIKVLEEGKRGVILTKGDNVFGSYYGDRELTKAAFVGGWFNTGDLGSVDGGFLYVKGRIKDQIRTLRGESPDVGAETEYSGKGRISKLIVVGNGMQRAGVLVVPDETSIKALAGGLSERDLIKDICKKELADSLDKLGIPLDSSRVAIISDFSDYPALMTDTMKVRRELVAETYAGQIKRICNPKSN